MAPVKKYDISPELLGEYAFESSSAAQNRENVDRTNAARANQAELNQRGAIAAGQMQQHSLDRAAAADARNANAAIEADANAAIEADANRLRYQANADDNRTAETLQKLKGEQDAAGLEGQMQLKEFGADLERRNKLADDLNVPNFLLGPMQQHELAVGNQQLMQTANGSHSNELIAKASTGDKAAMQQAMAQGLFRFSPQQQQRLTELQGALGKLNDPRLSPADRVNGEIQIMQEMNSIQPQLVPKSERMPSLNDQLAAAIGVWTDPTDPTGQTTYPMALNRNGVPEVVDLSVNKQQFEPKTIEQAVKVDPKFDLDMRNQAYQRAMEIKKIQFDAMVKSNESVSPSARQAMQFAPPTQEEVQAQLDLIRGGGAGGAAAGETAVGRFMSGLGDRTSAAVNTNQQINAGSTEPAQSAAPAPAPTIQAPPANATVDMGGKKSAAIGSLAMGDGEQVPITSVKVGGQDLAASVKDGVATLLAWDESGKPIPVAQLTGEYPGSRRNPIKASPESVARLGTVLPIGTFIIVGDKIYENKPASKKK